MANFFVTCTFVLGICALIFTMNSSSTVNVSGDYQQRLRWMPSGSLVIDEEQEFALDFKISRRILATGKHISYSSLQKNRVACSRRGASYYNCHGATQANAPQRGCSAMTRCRG